jgi:hypothetical protein
MNSEEFLNHVLPDNNGDICYNLTCIGKGTKQYFYDTIEEAAKQALVFSEEELDVYYGFAGFDVEVLERYKKGERKNLRTAGNAKLFKCLALDIDVDESGSKINTYKSLEEAGEALNKFITNNNLPMPLVVCSGRGLHVYQVFTNAISHDKWHKLASAYKNLAIEQNLVIDPSVTADAARILRVVGTFNNKGEVGVPVIVLNEGDDPRAYTYWRNKLNTSSAETVVEETPSEPSDAPLVAHNIIGHKDDELSSTVKYSWKIIKESRNCQQINFMYDHKNEVSEPLWRCGTGVAAFCIDRDFAIHDLSKGYEGYDPEETEKKADGIKYGPISCLEFEKQNPNGCKGCEFKSRKGSKGPLKSPILLGATVEQVASEERVVLDKDTGIEKKISMPKDLPDGYIRSEKGIFKIREGDLPPLAIYPDDFWVQERLYSRVDGHMISLVHIFPHKNDGIEQWVMPYDFKSHVSELSKHGIVMATKKEENYIMEYIAAWINKLKTERAYGQAYVQMGWQDGQVIEGSSDNEIEFHTSFILGRRKFTAGGVAELPFEEGIGKLISGGENSIIEDDYIKNATNVQVASISSTLEQTARAFPKKGSLEKWTKAIQQLYSRDRTGLKAGEEDGEETKRFVMGYGLASPLFKFTPIRSALLHMVSGTTGSGKTSTLRAVASIWGHPKDALSQGGDTTFSWFQKLGEFNSVPFFIDEITEMNPKAMSQLIYSLSHGKGRDRMEGSTNRLRVNETTWCTGVITTANTEVSSVLKSMKNRPEAELARMLEIPVVDNDLTLQENTKLISSLDHNHGLAAEKFIPWVLANQVECERIVSEVTEKIVKECNLDKRHRFKAAMGGVAIAGLLIGNKLGIWDFEVKSTFQWFVNMLLSNKEDEGTDRDRETRSQEDCLSILGEFFNEHRPNTLQVDDSDDDTDGLKELINVGGKKLRPEALYIRDEIHSKQIVVIRSRLLNWCNENAVQFKELINDIASIKDGKGNSAVLSKNKQTRIGKGHKDGAVDLNIPCVVFDATKLIPLDDDDSA